MDYVLSVNYEDRTPIVWVTNAEEYLSAMKRTFIKVADDTANDLVSLLNVYS